jgi:hypothetical protein
MSRALRELGLGPDADERSIKRAYAAKLKSVRPDTDPEGFQRLHAAYQDALNWVREHREDMASVVDLRSDSVSASADTSEDSDLGAQSQAAYTQILSAEALFERLGAQDDESHIGNPHRDENTDARDSRTETDPRLDAPSEISHTEHTQSDEHISLDAFFEDCAALAANGSEDDLLNWLNSQPFLWSLEHKTQIAHWLLRYLYEQRPPIEVRHFDVLANFFGILDLNSGYDPYSIQRLRHRLQLAWEIQTDQVHALAQRTSVDGGSIASNLRQVRRMLRQVKQPFNVLKACITALVPMYPTAIRQFLLRMDFGNLDDLPPQIDRGQIEFWEAAGDRTRISKRRLQVGLTRCFAYALIGMIGTFLIKWMTPDNVIALDVAWKAGTIMLIVLLQGWLMLLGGQACMQWQCLPEPEEDEQERFRWLRLAFIPMLALLAVALNLGSVSDSVAAFLSVVAFVLAWRRYHQRNGPLLGFISRAPAWYGLILIGPLLTLFNFAPNATIGGMATLALLLWFADLRKQRNASKAERETPLA